MTNFLQLMAGAVTLGSMYALVAAGWGVVLNVTGVLNITHGELVVIAGLLAAVTAAWGWPLATILVVSVAGAVVLSLLVEQLAVGSRPGRRSPVHSILITLGLALVLAEVARIVFGADPFVSRPLVSGVPISLGGVTIPRRALPVWGVSVIVFVLLAFFERSSTGRMMAACASNQDGARYCGIDTKRMSRVAFLLSGLLAGVTGFVFVTMIPLSASSGLSLGLKGFVALIIARSDRTQAALAGGMALAVLEVLVAGYGSSRYQDVVAYAVLLIVLLVRAARAREVRSRRTRRTRPARA